jgi:hypothetical protein
MTGVRGSDEVEVEVDVVPIRGSVGSIYADEEVAKRLKNKRVEIRLVRNNLVFTTKQL